MLPAEKLRDPLFQMLDYSIRTLSQLQTLWYDMANDVRDGLPRSVLNLITLLCWPLARAKLSKVSPMFSDVVDQ